MTAKYIESATMRETILAASDPVKKKLREQRSKLVKELQVIRDSKRAHSQGKVGKVQWDRWNKQIVALEAKKTRINEELKK